MERMWERTFTVVDGMLAVDGKAAENGNMISCAPA